jgi:FkbH-like protein
MERLGLAPADIRFSGYNQAFQELMAPGSLLTSDQRGVNLILIRLEDWGRDQEDGRREETIRAATLDFIKCLGAFARRSRRPTLLFLCPISRQASARQHLAGVLQMLSEEIRAAADVLSGISVIHPGEISELYPVPVVDDPEADRAGHIPFSQDYWVAIGTFLARKARTILQPPHKVIAVDADNTLWGGVAAEAGASHVQVTAEWRKIQEFLLNRKNCGMLLILVSKNRDEDVAEVFSRPDMTLRREDFAVWKVDWKAKSENLRAAASELALGLDSFIFLDDNPMECAEVAAHCPQVTVMPLPPSGHAVAFLKHLWALDLPSTTSADSDRTEQYLEQAERKRFLASTHSFAEFFEKLELRVDFDQPVTEQVERAAQLTQRTNQFNTTGLRRTVAELAYLLASGERTALLARVGDRFGDYGEVGLCVYRLSDRDLEAENFLLSCRVLGKGVEHQMLSALGSIAERCGKTHVTILFKPTARNEPAARFLDAVGGAFRDEYGYRFPVAEAVRVAFDPRKFKLPPNAEKEPEEGESRLGGCNFDEIARNLGTVPQIQLAIRRQNTHERPALVTDFGSPRDSVERKLVEIWADVLGLDVVGIYDNFFDLGGNSVQGIQILSRANQAGLVLTLKQQFQFPTIAGLALHVRTKSEGQPDPRAVATPAAAPAAPSPRFPLARLGQKSLDDVMARVAKADSEPTRPNGS